MGLVRYGWALNPVHVSQFQHFSVSYFNPNKPRTQIRCIKSGDRLIYRSQRSRACVTPALVKPATTCLSNVRPLGPDPML